MSDWLKKHGRKVLMAILAAVLAVSLTVTAVQRAQDRANAEANAEAAELAGLPPVRDQPAVESRDAKPGENDVPPDVAALLPVNLEALQAVNPDVMGWIEIPGTELSYPIVQGEDNRCYLDHNWKGESNRGGSIFLEATSGADFTGFHTIIYGHRMRDGSMFGSLRHYRDQSYWQEHPDVYIAAGGRVYRYAIFSAHESGIRDLTYRLDLVESGLQGEFLQYCADGSVIDTGGAPDTGHILTLSTCTGSGYRTRWVVHCYLAGTWEA